MPRFRPAPPAWIGVLALVLALLWSLGWGQVHRVLHPGAQVLSVADPSAQAVAPDLGDEDGSGLCKLLDHLTHGAGPVTVLAVFPKAEPPAATPAALAPRGPVALTRSFDARGPPRLT